MAEHCFALTVTHTRKTAIISIPFPHNPPGILSTFCNEWCVVRIKKHFVLIEKNTEPKYNLLKSFSSVRHHSVCIGSLSFKNKNRKFQLIASRKLDSLICRDLFRSVCIHFRLDIIFFCRRRRRRRRKFESILRIYIFHSDR